MFDVLIFGFYFGALALLLAAISALFKIIANAISDISAADITVWGMLMLGLVIPVANVFILLYVAFAYKWPWTLREIRDQFLSELTPEDVRDLIDKQLLENNVSATAVPWLDNNWSNKTADDRRGFAKEHLSAFVSLARDSCTVAANGEEVFGDWAGFLRTAAYGKTGSLT